MLSFLIYEGKAAIALAVFYVFYRLLLKKESFHLLNRIVLVGMVVVSFLLPLCIITIHRPMEMTAAPVGSVAVGELVTTAPVAATTPWWPMALIILFWAGVTFVLIRELISVFSIDLIIRLGQQVREEDGCKIVVTDQEIAPLSWMRYIILSRKDWEGPHAPILAHEKAHVAYGHSVELLLVDILAAFQWFNPAIWMLRADLQELHEYEADDAVLRSGVDLKEYQYLLIRKAVGKSGYSVANSFNHSILKNRITMMSKPKSPLLRGMRVLYVLPLICLGIGLQARTVYVPKDKDSNNIVAGEGYQDNVKKVVTMNVDAEGRILIEGKEIPLNGIADYLRSLDIPGAEIGVSIEQVENTPAEVMTALRDQLRQAGVLKAQYRAFASTPLYMLRQPSGEERVISQEEFRSLDQRRMVSTDVLMGPDATEKYGEIAKNGAIIVTYNEGDINMDPISHTYYLTPFEFSTLVVTDMEGKRITDFRTQKTLTAGQDEFLGICVREDAPTHKNVEKPQTSEYVVRPVGGKPIKTIQWQSPPASTHVLYINGRSIGEFQKDEAGKNDEVMLAPRFQHGTTHQFDSWVHAHLVYPQRARVAGIEGVVLTSYDVCEDGKVRNVRVLVGIDDQLDAEAVRVISSSPRWEPAIMNNKPVKVSIQLPVKFTLNERGDILSRQDDDTAPYYFKDRRTEDEAIPVVRIKRGNGEPLVIVNGEKMEDGINAIKLIDPSTIESMEVRKDSSLVAHYGPEAANGVLWICTTQ